MSRFSIEKLEERIAPSMVLTVDNGAPNQAENGFQACHNTDPNGPSALHNEYGNEQVSCEEGEHPIRVEQPRKDVIT